MNIASKSTATPNRVEMLFDFIKSENRQYTKHELQELFSPQSDSVFKDNFSVLEALQLVKIEDDIVKINIEKSRLRNLDIIKKSIFDEEFIYKNNFVYALSWLMMQNKETIKNLDFSQQVNNLILKDLNEKFSELDLTSNAPWQNFYYWCNYLGFANKSYIGKQTIIVPDPTEAILNELKYVFEEKRELTIISFLKTIAINIPVLEFGFVRKKIIESAREGLVLADNQLSFSTSLALLRLEERGIIKLGHKSDADSMSLMNSNGNRIISHITYVGK